ncbi:MAG: hypothetical protein AB8H47_21705 [Bacteroidia bacterium]
MKHKAILLFLFVSIGFSSLSGQSSTRGISIGIPGLVNYAPFYGPYKPRATIGEKLRNKISGNIGYVFSYHFKARNGRQWFLTQQSTWRPYRNTTLYPEAGVLWRPTFRLGGGKRIYFFDHPKWHFAWELGADVGKRWSFTRRTPYQFDSPLRPYFGLHVQTNFIGEHISLGVSFESRILAVRAVPFFNLNASYSILPAEKSQEPWKKFLSDQSARLNIQYGIGLYLQELIEGTSGLGNYYGVTAEYWWRQKENLRMGINLGLGYGYQESIFISDPAYYSDLFLVSVGHNYYWRLNSESLFLPYVGAKFYVGFRRSKSTDEILTEALAPLLRTGIRIAKPHHRCFFELGINSTVGVELGLGFKLNTVRRSTIND